ncbi:unnamed protein product, partial [Closterium sp. NIES-54]
VDPLLGTVRVEVAVVPGAAPGAASGGAEPGGAGSEGAGSGGAEPEDVEPGGAESEGAEPGGAELEGVESGGAEPWGAALSGGPAGASPRLSLQQLSGGAAVTTGAGDPTEPGAAGAGGAGAGVAGVGGLGAGGARAAGAGAIDPGAGGAGGTVRLHTPCCQSSVARLPATAVTNPSFESAAASALVAELLDLADVCRLNYASALVAESVSTRPPSVGGECALGTDVLEDRHEDFECLAAAVPRFASSLLAPEGDPDAPDIPTPRSYAEAITGPYSSQWQAAMDAEMASWKSTGTYVDEFPSPGVNIVDGMWIFRVKRPPGSLPAFKARYVAPAAQGDYELHSLVFSRAFLQSSLHEEIWLRRPPGFTGSFPTGTQWSLRRPVYDLRQVPHEWHDTLRTTLAALRFVPSKADPSLFLRTDTFLPPFYVLVYVNDLVFATADTEALTPVKSELQKRHTCSDLCELRSYLGLHITRDRARRTITLTQSHMVHQVLQRFGF